MDEILDGYRPDLEEHRRSSRIMRETGRCYPPGHTWPPHPTSDPAKPGPCVCGQEWMDQDMCDAVNWRCEP